MWLKERLPYKQVSISFLLDKKRDIEYIPLTLSRGYYDFLQSGLWLTLLNSCKSWPFFFLVVDNKTCLGIFRIITVKINGSVPQIRDTVAPQKISTRVRLFGRFCVSFCLFSADKMLPFQQTTATDQKCFFGATFFLSHDQFGTSANEQEKKLPEKYILKSLFMSNAYFFLIFQ